MTAPPPNTELPLRDIHLPVEPSSWPPAPGWWILGAVLAAVLIWIAIRLFRRWQILRRRRRLLALYARETDFDHCAGQPVLQLQAASAFLRRCCRRDAPQALTLRGADWLAYLDRGMEDQPFSRGPGRLLVEGLYQAHLPADQVQPALDVIGRRLKAGLP